MAASMRLVIPIPQILLLFLITGLALGLEVFVPYHRYSKFLRWLTLSLGAYVAALIAILGTTISPYLFFWQCSEEVEEEVEHRAGGSVLTSHARAMRVDRRLRDAHGLLRVHSCSYGGGRGDGSAGAEPDQGSVLLGHTERPGGAAADPADGPTVELAPGDGRAHRRASVASPAGQDRKSTRLNSSHGSIS